MREAEELIPRESARRREFEYFRPQRLSIVDQFSIDPTLGMENQWIFRHRTLDTEHQGGDDKYILEVFRSATDPHVSVSVTRDSEDIVSGLVSNVRTYYIGVADIGLKTQSYFVRFEGLNGQFLEVRNDGTIITPSLTYVRVAKTR